MDKGAPIRSISRGIAVLQAINRAGSLNLREISRSSRIPYPTAFRIVQTLQFEGIIEREAKGKSYRATPMVRSLAAGFQEEESLTEVARPHIVAFTKRTLWPLVLTTRVGLSMMVRDSTNALTPLSYHTYHPGSNFPLLESACGRIFLAYSDAADREGLLRAIKENMSDFDKKSLFEIERGNLLSVARARGVAVQSGGLFTAAPGKTLAIAAPILVGGKVCGALSVIIFISAMTLDEAIDRYAEDLIAVARNISADYSVATGPYRS